MNLNDFLPLLLGESFYNLVAVVQPGLQDVGLFGFFFFFFGSTKMVLQHGCNLHKECLINEEITGFVYTKAEQPKAAIS